MSNLPLRVSMVFGVFALILAGCCTRNDVYCSGTTTFTIKAKSGNNFPNGPLYSLHWTSGVIDDTITSDDIEHFSTNDSDELRFISLDLDGQSTVEVEFYVDEELIAGPEPLEITWTEAGTCDNVDGPAWCDSSPFYTGSVELVLDAEVW